MSDKIHLELQLLNDGVYIHIWNGSKRFIRPEQWKLGEVKSYSGELECLEDLIFNFLNHKNTNKEETAKLAGWLGDLSEWVHTELKERYPEEELYLFNDLVQQPEPLHFFEQLRWLQSDLEKPAGETKINLTELKIRINSLIDLYKKEVVES